MIRALVTLLLVAVAAPVQAMSITTPYTPITRSAFVAEVLEIGLTQVAADGFDSPAGYRLHLEEAASEFCAFGSLIGGDSFDGSFRLGDTIYRISASADLGDEYFERIMSIAANVRGTTVVVALERIRNRIVEVTRSDPGHGLVPRSPMACQPTD